MPGCRLHLLVQPYRSSAVWASTALGVAASSGGGVPAVLAGEDVPDAVAGQRPAQVAAVELENEPAVGGGPDVDNGLDLVMIRQVPRTSPPGGWSGR